jgi:hypothetical protein
MDIEAQETNNKELLNMEKEAPNYCQAIKKNGRPCRQCGKENQTGGLIIYGYCKYHKHIRKKDPENDPDLITTLN